jgi:hypothetical protein
MTDFPYAVASGGWRYATACFALALPAIVFAPPLAAVALALGVGSLWFHRDPERTPPESGIIAPADGHISVIREEGDRVRVGTVYERQRRACQPRTDGGDGERSRSPSWSL